MTGSGSAPALDSKTSSHSRLWLQLWLHTPALKLFIYVCYDQIQYFIFSFIFYSYPSDLQESDGGAIHRVGNYPNLLLEMPRYCCKCNLIEILLQFRTPCQDHQAGESSIKCLSQEQNRMAQVSFELRPCQSSAWCFNHLTTLPT